MQRRLKFLFVAWAALLGLYALGWIAWQDDRAPAILFLAWSAVGIPLYAFSHDLLDGRPRSPRWIVLVALVMWMDAVIGAIAAVDDREFSHLALIVTIGPALISLIALIQLGKKWRLVPGAPTPDGT